MKTVPHGHFVNMGAYQLKTILGTKYHRVLQIPGLEFYYIDSRGRYHVVPHQMRTDGGSVPYIFQHIPDLDSYTLEPAYIIHDMTAWFQRELVRKPDVSDELVEVCIHRAVFTIDDREREAVLSVAFDFHKMTSRQNDALLNEAIVAMMVELGRRDLPIQRGLINLGLALFGWLPWMRYKKKKVNRDTQKWGIIDGEYDE